MANSYLILTQGGEWDPTVLDHTLTDDPDWVSKVKREARFRLKSTTTR